MGQRPRLLGFLGWFLLAGNLVAIAVILLLWNEPELNYLGEGFSMPAWWYKGEQLVLSAGAAFAGFGILKGRDWSRYLYVGVFVASILIDYVIDQDLPDRPVTLLFISATSTCLFLPASNKWFGQGRHY